MARTATTAHAILGLLALRREWSTWELTKQLRRNMRFFWPRAESQIYEEAKSLVAKGLARDKQTFTGRRARTTYAITAKGEIYHLVDFLRHFYQQPLLHRIKDMNIQRPSDSRAQGRRELDINITVEALVLDNAQARPTLLPVIREMGLLSGGAGQTGYNMQAASSGHGSPVPPSDILAEPAREYLTVAGKDFFFGPLPRVYEKSKLEDDHSPFITLTSIVGHAGTFMGTPRLIGNRMAARTIESHCLIVAFA